MENPPIIKPPEPAGYLVIRMKPGDGFIVDEKVEVRVANLKGSGEVHIAVRAPKDLVIRRLK